MSLKKSDLKAMLKQTIAYFEYAFTKTEGDSFEISKPMMTRVSSPEKYSPAREKFELELADLDDQIIELQETLTGIYPFSPMSLVWMGDLLTYLGENWEELKLPPCMPETDNPVSDFQEKQPNQNGGQAGAQGGGSDSDV